MNDIEEALRQHLVAADYDVGPFEIRNGRAIAFENDSVLGFVLIFPNAQDLLDGWHALSTALLQTAQFPLRRAEAKAWNTYLVLLAGDAADYGQSIALSAIEEDLVGTRKIARAGMTSSDEVRSALLPLLPVQNAPQLDVVQMAGEIRLRTSELPDQFVEAFLASATEATLLQILEDGQ